MKNDGWRKVKGGGIVNRGGIIIEARQKNEEEAVENKATEKKVKNREEKADWGGSNMKKKDTGDDGRGRKNKAKEKGKERGRGEESINNEERKIKRKER